MTKKIKSFEKNEKRKQLTIKIIITTTTTTIIIIIIIIIKQTER